MEDDTELISELDEDGATDVNRWVVRHNEGSDWPRRPKIRDQSRHGNF
jgi:hypothetical protein